MEQTITRPSAAEYAFRKSAFDVETRFRLEDDALVVEDVGRRSRRVPFSAIRRVHLKLHATRARNYYQCRIQAEGTSPIFLQHLHYRGIADLEDRRAEYAPFVRALLAALEPYRDRVRIHSGSGAAFAGNVVGAVVMAAIVVAMLLIGQWIPAVLAALILLRLLVITGPSRRRAFAPTDVPADLLPQ